jgi:hypothetical protein
MKKKSGLILTVFFALVFNACKKGPGEGGNSSIQGTVNTILYLNSAFIEPYDTFPSADKDVFIIYGDDISFSDKVQTNYDGKFEFKYLREGSYKVYVYSEAPFDSLSSEEYAVIKQVEITGKKQDVDAGLFEIKDK